MKKQNKTNTEFKQFEAMKLGIEYEQLKQGKRLITIWKQSDRQYESLFEVQSVFESLLERYPQIDGLAGFFIAGRKYILKRFEIIPEKELLVESKRSDKEIAKEEWKVTMKELTERSLKT